jgi:diguanylate cyclase (GGDEF)-like protein
MKNKLISIPLAVMAALFCFTAFVYNLNRTQHISDLKELNAATDRISAELGNAFAYADILELLIKFHDGENLYEDFVELSNMAMENTTCIDSFQLAPDAIVTYINPMEGDEAAIGHNLLNDPARKDYVLAAINSNSVVMQGPVDSVQGDTLIFGRKAITVDGSFWGLAIISVNFETLLKNCGIADNTSLDFLISVYDSNDNLTYVWGDKNDSDSSGNYADISFSGQRWRISIQHDLSFSGYLRTYWLYILISILIGVLIYIVTLYYINKIVFSRTDSLTKTLNRAAFEKQTEMKLKYNRQTCALIAIDLDKFKYINDTYGHAAGDEVLISTASRMKSILRASDLVSRIGGDEYMILLSHIRGREQLFSIIDRLRIATEQEIQISNDYSVAVGISIGYALSPLDGTDYNTLYKIADQRMYEDKSMRNARKAL